jgi:hypothetical protein
MIGTYEFNAFRADPASPSVAQKSPFPQAEKNQNFSKMRLVQELKDTAMTR